MLNKAILIGRLGRDPETRYTGGGTPVTNFSIATSETFKNKNGEKQEKTEWHKIVAWGKLAEICDKYCKKGGLVYIEGQINTRKWQDKEGNDRYSTEITARTMRLLGSSGGRTEGRESSTDSHYDDDPHGHEPQESASTSAQRMGGSTGPEISDEDIPF